MKIFLVPFLLDFLLFFVMLRVADAAGREMQLSNAQTTALLIAWSASYMVVCPFIGRVLNARNTKPILVFSIVTIGIFSVPLLFTNVFLTALILISLLGASAALAFNSFQGLVRNQSPTGGLATTVGRYTLSWSMGIGLGFLLGGIFRSLNEPLLLALSVFISCSVLLGIVWSFKPDAQAENTTSSTRAEENSAVANPIAGIDVRYIAVAWTLLLTANFVQRPLTTFLPKFSAQAENPSWMAGVLLATMLFAQAITGYAMSRKTHWLYRLKPMFLVQIGVIALLGFLWFAQNFFVTILLMMCLGALHGFVYFASVYMASNSAQSARNIGINEMMVGIGNIGGMFFSAGAIRVAGFERAFFPATMILATLVLVWQMWWLRRGDRVVTS